jgi:hypothetical protein
VLIVASEANNNVRLFILIMSPAIN